MARKDMNPYLVHQPGYKAFNYIRRGFYGLMIILAIAVAITYIYWG